MKRYVVAALAVPVLLFGLSACVVAPARVAYSPPAVVVAPVAPPPLRVEVMTASPGVDYFWIAGHWRWDGYTHRWYEGRWERHREHAHWVPNHWEQNDRGQWHFHEGHWRVD